MAGIMYAEVEWGSGVDEIEACLFDVFGTVVDWHGGVTRELRAFGDARGIHGVD